MKKELTPKQARFIEEYLKDLNGTQAAIRAGYSPHTANEQAARLLAKASVQEDVKAKQEILSKRTGITQEWVLENLKHNAVEAQVASKFTESNRAFELLGKHLGMFTDKTDHSGTVHLRHEDALKQVQ